MIFEVDNVIPLEKAASSLFAVHPHDEIAHDALSLVVHLGSEVLLLAFVLLHHHLELLNLVLVSGLSLFELLNVVEVHLLLLFAAELLPSGESLV